jgi:POT family proton-dependent oligopeptide transporter
LYAANDTRRDGGYAIFYIGINLGALLAPFICGTLGEDVGWHWGFAAAGVGILCALALYFAGWKYLPADAACQVKVPAEKPTAQDWKAIVALLLLAIPLTLYWACNEQQGNTVALWSMNNTNRAVNFFGLHFQIDWTWFQSINPFVIFAGTPLILAFWRRQGKNEPDPVKKMAIGCGLMVAANLLMAAAAWAAGGQTHWSWLTAYFVILTIGEIYLYPVGLSLYSRVAPVTAASLIMGVYFIPNFLGGGFLQGWLGTFWDKMDKSLFFVMIAAIAGMAGLIIWAMEKPLKPYLEKAHG